VTASQRFALRATTRSKRFEATGSPSAETRAAELITVSDRLTGTTHSYPSIHLIFGFGFSAISDQGDLVLFDPTHVWHIPFGKPRTLLVEGCTVAKASISAQGNHAFVWTTVPPGKLNFQELQILTEIDLSSRAKRVLYEGYDRFIDFTIGANGQRLLLQRRNELLLWNRFTGWRSLLSHDEGFSETLLTDDGNTAFAITGTRRYLRIDTNSGEVRQLYAPMPFAANQVSGGALPGSVLRFAVFQDNSNLSLSIEGRDLPIIKSERGVLDAQIPWEATDFVGRAAIAEITTPDSPFALRRPVTFDASVRPWAFTFQEWFGILKFSEDHLVAANEDFTKQIDPRNPTTPGSLIHFWLTGLGPLDHPVPTGQPAPIEPMSRPLASLNCNIAERGQPSTTLEVLDVIYAPQLIGVYQVDVRIPTGWSKTQAEIRCTSGSSPSTGGLVAVQPSQQ
jgi:uncharacterized protein (TIGR03437 family)